MRKTWKKSIAMACAAAMVMTCTNWPVMNAEARTVTSEWITTKNHLDVQLSVRYNGENDFGSYSGNLNNLFDGNVSTNAYYYGNNLSGDRICKDDYIQVSFKTPITFKGISFTAPAGINEGGDWYSSAKLEYTTDGSTWNSLTTFDTFALTYAYQQTDGVIENVSAVRLTDTEDLDEAGRQNWLQIAEIEITATDRLAITQKPKKTVYRVGEEFDKTGLLVSYYDTNGDATTVDNVNISGFDTSTTGTKEITIAYENHETTFNINVINSGDEYPSAALKYAVSEAQGGQGVACAFDKDAETIWHSNWYPTGESFITDGHVWIVMKLENEEIINAVEWDSRVGNGAVTSYEIYGTTDDVVIDETTNTTTHSISNADSINWVKLSEGTWTKDAGKHRADFPATKLKAIKVVPMSSEGAVEYADANRNKFVSVSEIRVMTGAAEATSMLLGSSLRMDYQDKTVEGSDVPVGYTRTGLRFGYSIPKMLNEMEVADWDWEYGLSEEALKTTAFEEMPKYVVDKTTGNYISNLVIGGTSVDKAIKDEYYNTAYFSRIKVTYGDPNGIYTTIYGTLTSDTVYEYATRASADTTGKVDANVKTFAEGIKAAWETVSNN